MRLRPGVGGATFAALSNRNYRRFFFGQTLSLVGTWMQTVALSWLVLELTGSGTALGLVLALERLPVLLVAPYGGVIADRVDKRRLLVAVQATMASLALAFGVLIVTGVVAFWHACLLAVLLGLSNAFENPARQAFTLEMVGPDHLRNAVSLNSVTASAARAVGAAVGGVLIATVGTDVCFLVNAATFGVVIYALVGMEAATLHTAVRRPRVDGELREGLRYVARTPALRVPLMMMALVGMLTYEWQVVLPVVARDVLHGDASTYGWLTSAMGVGAVVGGLAVAGRGTTGLQPLTRHAAVFGTVILVAAVAPGLPSMLVALTVVGAASVAFLAVANSTLQLACDAGMRGRVMALFAVAFLGTTPIGGPIAGAVSEHVGGRAAMAMQGGACFAAALLGAVVLRRARPVQLFALEPDASAAAITPPIFPVLRSEPSEPIEDAAAVDPKA